MGSHSLTPTLLLLAAIKEAAVRKKVHETELYNCFISKGPLKVI